MAAAYYQYPLGQYAYEQPLWLNFYAATYSLINRDRTRPGIINRSFVQISLPMPKEPGYTIEHEFGEGTNPVGPVLSAAGLANSGGSKHFDTLWNRYLAPGGASQEYMQATSTFRRFSNITEASMISEARKKYYFEYVFVPKNQSESIAVEGLVNTFKKVSYPSVASGLPERTYPQNLWVFNITPGANAPPTVSQQNLTGGWLGDPLPCVLANIVVKKNDRSDPVIRYLPNGMSNVTTMALGFVELETGTYDPSWNEILSKSEISTKYFGTSGTRTGG